MKNILFSATRQFNPGDELILLGILNLLDRMGLRYNRLLYNRHPMITPNRLPKRLAFRRSWHSDNSFYLDDPEAVDYMIIAGSPEWRIGGRMEALFEYVLKNRIPCAFLAVGAGSGGAFTVDDDRHRLLRRVMDSHCELLTVRDREAEKALGSWSPRLLPCTALFSAKTQRPRTGPEVVGLVFQNRHQRFNSVRPEVADYLTEQYDRLLREYPGALVICHTCADFLEARRAFPGADVRYSALAEDYESIYDACDLVAGPRVHGAGLAASLGIPGILVQHSARGLTGWGFRAVPADPGDDLSAMIRGIDVERESRKLLEWKEHWARITIDLLASETSVFRREAGGPSSSKET